MRLDFGAPNMVDEVESIARHLPYLRRFSRCLLSDKAAADELVRGSLVEALSRTSEIETRTDLRAWLYSILWSRHEKFVHRVHGGSALECLSDDQRAVLGLVSLDGMRYRDAAKILHLDVRTLRARLSDARHALGDAMGAAPRRAAA
jgi:RNA polymerase sigma-70 factor (ECF subfamily)